MSIFHISSPLINQTHRHGVYFKGTADLKGSEINWLVLIKWGLLCAAKKVKWNATNNMKTRHTHE